MHIIGLTGGIGSGKSEAAKIFSILGAKIIDLDVIAHDLTAKNALGYSLIMLVFGYLGEANFIDATLGFVIGMVGWLLIIYEIFLGEASKINADSANLSCQKAFNALRLIVTIGWAIYPIGYFWGYLLESANVNAVNIIYNYADLINKTAFGLVIWAAAKQDSKTD